MEVWTAAIMLQAQLVRRAETATSETKRKKRSEGSKVAGSGAKRFEKNECLNRNSSIPRGRETNRSMSQLRTEVPEAVPTQPHIINVPFHKAVDVPLSTETYNRSRSLSIPRNVDQLTISPVRNIRNTITPDRTALTGSVRNKQLINDSRPTHCQSVATESMIPDAQTLYSRPKNIRSKFRLFRTKDRPSSYVPLGQPMRTPKRIGVEFDSILGQTNAVPSNLQPLQQSDHEMNSRSETKREEEEEGEIRNGAVFKRQRYNKKRSCSWSCVRSSNSRPIQTYVRSSKSRPPQHRHSSVQPAQVSHWIVAIVWASSPNKT